MVMLVAAPRPHARSGRRIAPPVARPIQKADANETSTISPSSIVGQIVSDLCLHAEQLKLCGGEEGLAGDDWN